MSSEGKYTNIEYQNFFEKNLSDTDPEIYKALYISGSVSDKFFSKKFWYSIFVYLPSLDIIYFIFLTLLKCLPLSNLVFKKILTQFKANFALISLDPKAIILASLCNLDNLVFSML